MIGVWKAGAAFVALEDGHPAEQVAFIRKDCGCRLTIDDTVWQEIQGLEPLPGYEAVDDHDAAFAVYTSGSTGNPKGVLHEYGKIDRTAASFRILNFLRFGLIAPVNYAAALIVFITTMDNGGVLCLPPVSLDPFP